VARGLPRDLDLLHFPVTVPIPRTRLPHVVTLHDVQHHDLPEFFPRAERELRRLTYDRAAARATAVVTPSEYARRRIVEVLGIPAERVTAIHHGIDHERFRPEPGEDDERLLAPLEIERPFVLYPANLWPHKNHERLVEAFARLRHLDVELLLTGQTYGRLDPLLEHARAAGARVRHLGYLDLDAMPALYRAARALAFPSLYEGFGGPPLEAMASGCPVASSTRASLAEVVGDAALALDPDSVDSIADTLERVVTDEELRSRLRAAGFVRARAFSWRSSAERHQAIYERVCATSSAALR
jgi:glycosyltransferase involved in cell wall biosynthesis